ncbi:hypothetical protein FMN52_00995 [Marinobacter sp. BW6]|uniref:hypothetical protein n=1 Tax=Marinobacter sp. BW6 TaxID=2592624 RepID=UPI0011DEFC3F|nr:hypothetical protein [Marinobacter sp. BW6]TYC63832.1 hypothetical protein FMN52_00995 [Marinobacter sp. BW6]
MNNLLDPFFPSTLPGVIQVSVPVPAIAFVLSSGRTFGLTIVRARNRLLKVSNLLKVNIESPETKSLIEWIEIYPEEDPRVQYLFCGYSLNTTDQFCVGLPESDSEELQVLLSTEDLTALFTELETYRGNARESTFRILEVPMKWRSRLTEWAQSFKDKCPEDQFRNRMLKQPGLRKEECLWHDLVRWAFYGRPPGPVDPSQLNSEFRLRHVIPRLYRLVGSVSPDPGVLWRCNRGLRRGERRNLPKIGEDSRVVLQHPSLGFSVVRFSKNDLLGSSCGWIAIDNKGRPLSPGADITDDTIQDAAVRVLSSINRVVRSWALYSDSAQWAEYTLADSDERQEHLLVLDDFPHRFENNPHYEVNNVLLHVRTSIQYSRDGLRCLLVDELQSDWLQKRSDWGQTFRDGSDQLRSMPWFSDWYELGLKVVLQLAAKSQVDAIAIANSEIQKARYGCHFTDGGREFYDKLLPRKLAKLVKPWGLPETSLILALNDKSPMVLRTEKGLYEVLGPKGEVFLEACSSLLDAKKAIAASDLMRDGPEVPAFSITKEFKDEVASTGLMLFG